MAKGSLVPRIRLPALIVGLALVIIGIVFGVQTVVVAEETISKRFICSTCGHVWDGTDTPSDDLHDNVFTIDFGPDAAGDRVEVQNPALPRVVELVDATPDIDDDQDTSVFDGPNANPKVITLDQDGRAVLIAVDRTRGLRDGRAQPDANGVPVATLGGDDDFRYEVKAFHGNRLEFVHLEHDTGGLLHTEYVLVDNLAPSLKVASPERPLYVQRGIDVTFTAEFTDRDSGFADDAAQISTVSTGSTPGPIDPDTGNHETHQGAVRMVVAGNVIALSEEHFTAIAGGWRITRTLPSTAIQNVATHVPWYFEVADRAHNTRRMAGNIASETTAPGTDRSLVDASFRGGLHEDAFLGTSIRVVQDRVASEWLPIVGFSPASGTIRVATPFFRDDPTTPQIECPGGTGQGCAVGEGAKYEILGAGLIVVDSERPVAFQATTGSAYDVGAGRELTGLEGTARPTAVKVSFTEATLPGDPSPGSGLDPGSVSASAFRVSDNEVVSALVVGNAVYLTLEEALATADTPTITVAADGVRDRAGNGTSEKRLVAVDGLGPTLSLSLGQRTDNRQVMIMIAADEQLSGHPTVWVTAVGPNGAAPSGGEKAAVDSTLVRETGVKTYSYTHTADAGLFSTYVEGVDIYGNRGAAGHSSTADSPSAFTFEVDTHLNGDKPPKVGILDRDDVAENREPIEWANTMVIRVSFDGEGNEYPGDRHKTVRLTSAVLTHTRADGSTATRTFSANRDVHTTDHVTFAMAVVHPEAGRYTLTVSAEDDYGNSMISDEEEVSVSWEIMPAPNIPLVPGWNLISLPFLPVNPSINSVVPYGHPIDAVITYDSADRVWLISVRNAETGLFAGDVTTMTPSTAYFVRTDSVRPLPLHRPPVTTHDTPPSRPPDVRVTKGWNLVPVVALNFHVPHGVAADDYFSTLGSRDNPGWALALSYDPLVRAWKAIAPHEVVVVGVGETNPCTGKPVVAEDVARGTEPCQAGFYTERSQVNSTTKGDEDGVFDGQDYVALRAALVMGRGYWLYATAEGRIIP